MALNSVAIEPAGYPDEPSVGMPTERGAIEPRSFQLRIRMTPREMAYINRVSRQAKLSRSEWVRRVLRASLVGGKLL